MISLYVKTHLQTGLKYLGTTRSPDPHSVPGSGVYWKQHLRKYGSAFTTEIIAQFSTTEEAHKGYRIYAKQWAVEADNQWANLTPNYRINRSTQPCRKNGNNQKVTKLSAVDYGPSFVILNARDVAYHNRSLIEMMLHTRILITTNGRIRLNPRWEHYAQISPSVWDTFQDLYDWCDDGVRERVYCLLNDIDEPLGCSKCGSFVSFNIHKNCYNTYCSKNCVHTEPSGALGSHAVTNTEPLPNDDVIASPFKNPSMSV